MWTKKLILLSLISLVFGLKEKKLCGTSSMETIYLQIGEKGVITLDNHARFQYTQPKCSIDLITCPLCSIQINFQKDNMHCEMNHHNNEDICSCGKITLRETNYEKIIDLCDLSDDIFYKGFSRSVLILHDFFTVNSSSSISMIYTTGKNQNFINGTIGTSGSISSLKFPSSYPHNYGLEHVLSCDDRNCIITLIFTDFLLSPSSIIVIFDWNGTLLHFVPGSKTRPPYVSSTGPSLIVRFLANDGSYLGYKADYLYLKNTHRYNVNTECGGQLLDLGGYIYMYDEIGYYDCFWVIKPIATLSYMKTHLYLNVLNFTGTGEVKIHNGLTSESSVVAVLSNSSNISHEYVTPISKSFYISYKGFPSKLLISYAAFSYIKCLPDLEFLCNNNRCIFITLICDSIDHCGDNSDEIRYCPTDSFLLKTLNHHFWWPYSTNDEGQVPDEDVRQFSGLWMCGIIVVIVIMLLVSTTCHRNIRIIPMNSNQLDVQTTNEQIRTITQLLSDEDTIEDDNPPIYEPPPDYNQVINLSNQINDLRTKSNSRACGSYRTYEKASSSYVALESEGIDSKNNPNTQLKRRMSEISLPISLETAGYDEDLGVSLTISVTTNKESEQKIFSWMSKQTKLNSTNSMNSTNFSAASFDTLNSSQERNVNTCTHLVKSQSQDNLTSTSNDYNSTMNCTYKHLY